MRTGLFPVLVAGLIGIKPLVLVMTNDIR